MIVLVQWLTVGSGLSISNTTISVNQGAIDHGSLSGLGDDDHTQYLLVDGTRAMNGNLDAPAIKLTDSYTSGWNGWGNPLWIERDGHAAIFYKDPISNRGFMLGFHGGNDKIYIASTDDGWSNGSYIGVITGEGKVSIGDDGPDFTLDVAGDIRVQSSNKLYFGGTGSSDNDVNLYRSTTNVLKTDDNFDTLSLRISGTEVITSGRVLQNVTADAGIITSGTFNVDRIPNLSRSKITDFFSSPFWSNIPDKPSSFTPSTHASTHESGGSDTINHDNLAGFVANEHIDHSSVSIVAGTGLSGGGNLTTSRTLSLNHLGLQNLSDPNADRIMFWDDSSGALKWLTVSTGLSISDTTLTTNDAQIVHDNLSGFVANEHINHTSVSINTNYPLSGGGNIASTRTLSLLYDSNDFGLNGSNQLYIKDSGINHDSLSGFVANEHINHSSISINAGTGLSGGGDLTASRTISLNHLGLENLSDPNADRIMFWDDSAGSLKWLSIGSGLSITDTTLTAEGGVTDHGELTGLGDDDHTQYLLANGSRAMSGNFGPDTDNSRDFGSITKRWKDAYFVNIHTGDIKLKNDIIITEDGDDVVFKNKKGKQIFRLTSDGDIIISGRIKYVKED